MIRKHLIFKTIIQKQTLKGFSQIKGKRNSKNSKKSSVSGIVERTPLLSKL